MGIDELKYPTLKDEFKRYIDKNGLKQIIGDTPLVGYVIEFPPIENDPGGIYLQGDYELDLDEDLDANVEENADEFAGIIDNNEI